MSVLLGLFGQYVLAATIMTFVFPPIGLFLLGFGFIVLLPFVLVVAVVWWLWESISKIAGYSD
jgi:hypothetical protein